MRPTSQSSAIVLALLATAFQAPPARAQGTQESMLILQYRPSSALNASMAATAALPARIADYEKILSACVQSLSTSAQTAGLRAERRTDAPDRLTANLTSNPSTTYRVTLMVPNLVSGMGGGGQAILFPNAFTGPGHFASFLKSELYRSIRERPLSSLNAREPNPVTLYIAGLAYGSAIHLASSDRPMIEPRDVKDRISIAPFGMDAMVGAKDYSSADLRQTLPARSQANNVFIQAPTILLRDAVAKQLRQHLSLTMTRVVPVLFVVDRWSGLTPAQRDKLRQIVDEAAIDCSATNYDAEVKEIAALQSEGTQVVEGNRAAFRAASLFFQKERLDAVRPDDRNRRLREAEYSMFEKLADPESATPPDLPPPDPNPAPDEAPPPPQTFTFKVCNNKAVMVHVAYAGAASGADTRVRGWWQVQPKSCREIGEFKTGDFYFFAQTFNINPVQVFVAGSNLRKFCVEEKTFNFPLDKTCPASSKRDFSVMRVTNNSLTWNL